MVNKRLCAIAVALPILGCNVDNPPPSTGGAHLEPADAGAGDGASPRVCERGIVLVTSDYQSTNIVVSELDGTTLVPSFISSGATVPGLGLALSGDVDIPVSAPPSGRVVLIDRYGTNVITWLELATAQVIAQLPVGQGFESNPHDYLEVDARRAFVSRFGQNPTPGAEPGDTGGDLLIIDTEKRSIEGHIVMPEEDARFLSTPGGMTRVGKEVVVSLGRWAADYSVAGEGRLVGVSPESNSIVWTVDIKGLYACGRAVLSPSGDRLAIACSSRLDRETMQFDPKTSDIVIYDVLSSPPKEINRLGVAEKLAAGIQPFLAFATDDLLLATAYATPDSPGDRVFAVSTTTGAITPLGESQQPYAFSGMHCSPGCGDVCVLSDSEKNKLRRWKVSASGAFEALEDATIETEIGLPPRSIGGI